MTYRTATMVLNILVLLPAVAFVGLFLTTATRYTWRQLATIPLLVLPACAGALVARSLFLVATQSPEVRELRDATRTFEEQFVSITVLVLVAVSMWMLLIALVRSRRD